jgi:hypothetical protein
MTVAGALLAGLTVTATGCASLGVCSTIGYIYTGPAVIEFSEPLPPGASVAACFGADCEPAAVPRVVGDGVEVPQEAPFSEVAGVETVVTVKITQGNGTLLDDQFEIPTTTERTGCLGQCPGPFHFEPIVISLPDSGD